MKGIKTIALSGILAMLATLILVSPPASAVNKVSVTAKPFSIDQTINGESATDSSAINKPIIVVLDISGSMNERDRNDKHKLNGAKESVETLIRNLSDLQYFGVWTYPGGVDSCESGQFIIDPAPLTDKTGAIAKVDGLTADGGTPTGPAFRSVADNLRQNGISSATLVLVSDGESNCGEDPCSVASDLLDTGFDIVAHSVGFQISDSGREELSCIADVTGGTYVDAEDSEELLETIRDLSSVKLYLELSVEEHLFGGGVNVSFSITNVSGFSAKNITSHFEYDQVKAFGANTALPSLIPSRLGNLLPGSTIGRSFSFGASSKNNIEEGLFRLSVWGDNAARVSLEVKGSGSVRVDPREAIGDWLGVSLDAGHPVVIMGDSFSSGEGTFNYTKGIKYVSDRCHRSKYTYLSNFLKQNEVINLACSGAKTWDFYHKGPGYRAPAQLEQLESMSQAPGAVFLTLGGNDIGFEEIIKKCVMWHCDKDPKLLAIWLSSADWLRPWLSDVFKDIWLTVNTEERISERSGQKAPVVVLAYPQLTHATKNGICRFLPVPLPDGYDIFGPGEVAIANLLAARLNAAVKAAVGDAASEGYEVYFVAETSEFTQPNKTICDRGGYINSVLLSPSEISSFFVAPESVHPNINGYAAETGALLQWTRSNKRIESSLPFGNLDDRQTTLYRETLFNNKPKNVKIESATQPTIVTTSGLRIYSENFSANSFLLVSMHSTPVVLATATADENGMAIIDVPIPASVTPGTHQIVIVGEGRDGMYHDERMTVIVTPTPPLWVELGLPIAILLIISAAAFGVISLRSKDN